MIHLSEEQRDIILTRFEQTSNSAAHSAQWTRRSYAPMHIYSPEFESLRKQIKNLLPNYSTTFDVVFEVEADKAVEYHVDYESIGPFEVNDCWNAIKDEHFVTIHFNLTRNGGELKTLDWPVMSWLHYIIIRKYGIFSFQHKSMVWFTTPLFRLFEFKFNNMPLLGNIFNNMRLHGLTRGESRISYVIRLVKNGSVSMTPESVAQGMSRSAACEQAFRSLYDKVKLPTDASLFNWKSFAGHD